MNVLDLASRKVNLHKSSGTNGGEWQGPCPGCGGTDRFHVWPAQNEGNGGYWCRGCEKSGDNIQFLRDFEGLSFRDACSALGVSTPDRPDAPGAMRQEKKEKPSFTPTEHIPPADLWQERAEKLVTWSQAALENNQDVIAWLGQRGINRETARDHRLGWNPGEKEKDLYRPRQSWGLPEELKDEGKPKKLWIPRGLVIPYIIDGVIQRIRIRRPEGEPRYYVLPGSSMSTMIIGRDRRAFVIVESELDAVAVVAGNSLAGSAAMGSVSAKPDAETYGILKGSLQILNALDYDAAGAKAMAWWTEQFGQCDRWPVPRGKDPGDAARLGIDLESWIKAGLPPAMTIEAGAQKKEKELTRPPEKEKADEVKASPELPPLIMELYRLLRGNPGVKIITTVERFTVLRNGKYTGGRINELVFRVPGVTDYILNHPAEEIDGTNFIY
jgi:hypothetical protein